MSSVAQGAFALTPSESNFGGLTKRLLALRTEIDGFLVELASQAMAAPRGVAILAQPAPASPPPAEAPAAAFEQDLLPVLPEQPADSEAELERCIDATKAEAAAEPSVGEIEIEETVSAAAPERLVADSIAPEPSESEQDPYDWAGPDLEHPAPVAAIGMAAAKRIDEAGPLTEAEASLTAHTSHAISATEIVDANQQGDAATLCAPQQSARESAESEARPQEPTAPVDRGPSTADASQTGDSPAATTARADETLAVATVINLHARQRKHKGSLAIGTPMPARSGRRLAAKIAASILVLLTAATVLVMADRNAFGSVQSLPRMTPTPSAPTGIEWLLQRLRANAAQSSDETAPSSDLPLDDGPLAGRMGWGA